MSITKDANYAKMNYKNSESTYENLTPTALANKVNYNQNDLCYAPLGINTFRNNIESTNVVDAITEIENRVAQCGRKFDELEFGAGKDIDLLDGAGNQITLDTYYIGNIVYFPKTQKYYMLLYSFIYGRSVLLSSLDGILWRKDSDISTYTLIDVKCNSQYIFFIGYDNYLTKGLYYSTSINRLLSFLEVQDTYGNMSDLPATQYDLGKHFCMSFDMDENSILCLSLGDSGNNYGYERDYRIDYMGNIRSFKTTTIFTTSDFPKIVNINPGQYIYYMKGSEFKSELISLTKDNVRIKTDFPISNIYDVLLVDEFGCTTAYNNIYVRTDNFINTDSKLQGINIVNPNRINMMSSSTDGYAPPLLLAKRCCNNYIFFNNFSSTIKYWGYNNNFQFNSTMKSINDSNNNTIGNYVIETAFNPSFINKINDRLFIYTNNEVNSTTLNNSKLYISQIKI